MRLFTFNFNTLFRIISFFIVLISIYSIFIVIYTPKITTFQNQRQRNYSYAQDFIYNEKTPSIIVGSSMAARMNKEFLQIDYFNLSFAGGSVLTGLEIIKKSTYIPKYIYIENNIIFRNKDISMINSLFCPIWWKIKSFIPALQEKYQPLNIILSKLRSTYDKSHAEYMLVKQDNNIFNMSIKLQKEKYSKKLQDYSYELNDLKGLIKYFEDKGTVVIFFEMPIDNNLSLSIQSLEQREIIKSNFSNRWLSLPNNKDYITSDGLHLLYSSAYKFSKIFLEETKDYK